MQRIPKVTEGYKHCSRVYHFPIYSLMKLEIKFAVNLVTSAVTLDKLLLELKTP